MILNRNMFITIENISIIYIAYRVTYTYPLMFNMKSLLFSAYSGGNQRPRATTTSIDLHFQTTTRALKLTFKHTEASYNYIQPLESTRRKCSEARKIEAGRQLHTKAIDRETSALNNHKATSHTNLLLNQRNTLHALPYTRSKQL